MGIRIDNDELVTPRDFARGYANLMKKLKKGDLEKLVIARGGQMEAVVLTAEEYERLAHEDV